MASKFMWHAWIPQRPLITVVVGLISAYLALLGGQLALLGGSLYYLLAGIALAAICILTAKGSNRAIWLYAGLLAATLLWTFLECGSQITAWGFQSRMVAPLVLGIWVFWPSLNGLAGRILMGATVSLLIGAVLMMTASGRIAGSSFANAGLNDASLSGAGLVTTDS